jgi:hypothetical protein
MAHDTPKPAAAAPLAHLTATLDLFAGAVAAGDLATMLTTEPILAELTGRLSSVHLSRQDLPPGALDEARAALERCRALGQGLQAFIDDSLVAQGCEPLYPRGGRPAVLAVAGTLDARG